MSGTYLLLTTLATIVVSILAVRAGAIALTMTGMHYSQARFQALSAFTGTGFTTRAAESVVNHPARRRIASWLMLLGNAGIAVVIVTATSSFVNASVDILPLNVALFVFGLILIYVVVTRTGLAKWWEGFVEHRLAKSAVFEDAPAEEVLHLAEGYGLVRLTIHQGSLLAGLTVGAASAAGDHLILGLERGGEWIATPLSDEPLRLDDRVVVYGHLRDVRKMYEQS